MIPNVIHYCWFGRNPLPDSALKCIASWRRFFPEYEIKEWNEDNFDVNSIPYTKEAYEAKKYAFVSDYARYWVLYRHGGLYFDTDVEIIHDMQDIVEKGPFMGIEVPGNGVRMPKVAPGLGLGAVPGMGFYKVILEAYSTWHFLNEDGTKNLTTIVEYNTNKLIESGLRLTDSLQNVAGINIYPVDYFNPLDDLTGHLNITENTRSIHWYSRTWSDSSSLRKQLSRFSHKLFGMKLHALLKKLNFR